MHGDETCFTSRFLVRRDRLMGFVRKEEVQVEGIMVMGTHDRCCQFSDFMAGFCCCFLRGETSLLFGCVSLALFATFFFFLAGIPCLGKYSAK